MFRNFTEIENYVLNNKIKKVVALANAQDEYALSALVYAHKKGIVDAVLIGDVPKIKELLIKFGENPLDYEYISSDDEKKSAELAVSLVKEKQADILMKGLMMTSSFMRAILDKEKGLIEEGHLLSQASVIENKNENRFMVFTDCAVNISPDVKAKIKITQNAIGIMKKLGVDIPKIAVLSALEKVNPKILSTVEASEVAQSEEFVNKYPIIGPVAMDIALSKKAAEHKGIYNEVCGQADIFVMPDLDSGNICTKSLVFLSHIEMAGVLIGTKTPVIMTSRTDSVRDKYLSILLAVFGI